VGICEGGGLELANALEDPGRRALALRRARELSSMQQRPPPKEVFERLLSAASRVPRPAKLRRDEVVRCPRGNVLFRVKRNHRGVALLMPLASASPTALEEVKRIVAVTLGARASAAIQPTSGAIARKTQTIA